MSVQARIRIIGTGGTIAGEGKSSSAASYEAGKRDIDELIDNIDGLRELASIDTETLFSRGSEDLGPADWASLAQRIVALASTDAVDGIVITHGTDTMVETARALASVAGKVIVLTGALNPALFKGSDAVFNIGCAVGAVQSLPDGVFIAMNGRIWDPARVRKNVVANRFEEA